MLSLQLVLVILFMTLVSFLTGAVPFAFLIARRFYNIDIRQHGSGNIGATNVLRNLGVLPFFGTLILDVLKGYLPVAAGMMIFDGLYTWPCLFALAAIMGHTFTPFLNYKGGKGVATAAGAFVALAPAAFLAALIVFSISIAVTRYVAVGSILGTLALVVGVYAFYPRGVLTILTVAAAALIIIRHRANIKRLMGGTEPPVRLGGFRPEKRDDE